MSIKLLASHFVNDCWSPANVHPYAWTDEDGVCNVAKPDVHLCCLWSYSFRFALFRKNILWLAFLHMVMNYVAVFLYLVGLSSFSACTRFSCDAHLRYAGTGFTWVQLRSPTAVHRLCACQELVTGFSASHKCALATTQLCSCVQIGLEPSSDSEIAHIFSPNLPLDIKLPVFLSVALVAHVVQPFCNERFALLRYLSV